MEVFCSIHNLLTKVLHQFYRGENSLHNYEFINPLKDTSAIWNWCRAHEAFHMLIKHLVYTYSPVTFSKTTENVLSHHPPSLSPIQWCNTLCLWRSCVSGRANTASGWCRSSVLGLQAAPEPHQSPYCCCWRQDAGWSSALGWSKLPIQTGAQSLNSPSSHWGLTPF